MRNFRGALTLPPENGKDGEAHGGGEGQEGVQDRVHSLAPVPSKLRVVRGFGRAGDLLRILLAA